jgi:predicted dehydrogenase
MGQVHARAIRTQGSTVVGVLGSSPASSQAFAAELGTAEALTELSQAVALGADVVHICTPNNMHYSQFKQAAELGLSIVVEKPLATDLDEAREMVTLAKDLPMTAVPFVYRFHPLVLEIRRRIQNDPNNRLWLLHGSYLQDWIAKLTGSTWRKMSDKGGKLRAFGDIGIHWCDLMEFVTGHRITKVSARLGNTHAAQGADTEDGAVVMFETDKGAIGTLVVSQVSPGRSNRLWFSFDGEVNSYEFDQEHPDFAWMGTLSDNVIIRRDPASQPEVSRANALPPGHAQGYQNAFNDFVEEAYQVIDGHKSDVLATAVDGARAAAIAEAVWLSQTSGTWVSVPQHLEVPSMMAAGE